jgi:hypothetical protein
MYKVFFDPTNEIFMPNNLHCHVAVSLVARNGEQSWTFSLQRRRRKGRATAVVNRQYGSENVNFANGQTDRILVPCSTCRYAESTTLPLEYIAAEEMSFGTSSIQTHPSTGEQSHRQLCQEMPE